MRSFSENGFAVNELTMSSIAVEENQVASRSRRLAILKKRPEGNRGAVNSVVVPRFLPRRYWLYSPSALVFREPPVRAGAVMVYLRYGFNASGKTLLSIHRLLMKDRA